MIKEGTGRRTAAKPTGGPHDEPTAGPWWMICRSAQDGLEAMTLPCGGEEALALFGREEEAGLFLLSLGAEGSGDGWRIRESQRAEVASILYDASVGRVVLDPSWVMVDEGMAELASVDRAGFVARQMARR